MKIEYALLLTLYFGNAKSTGVKIVDKAMNVPIKISHIIVNVSVGYKIHLGLTISS